MNNKRERRLNSEFQKEIYSIIKNKIKMFSISEVDVTNDLKHAKVFVSVFSTDAEKKAATFRAIEQSAKAIRTELSKVMHIRTVPELHFVTDESAEYGNKIDKILSGLTYVTAPGEEDDDA